MQVFFYMCTKLKPELVRHQVKIRAAISSFTALLLF